MATLSHWLPLAFVGGLFVLFGLLTVYGLAMGIKGGGCKPLRQRLWLGFLIHGTHSV